MSDLGSGSGLKRSRQIGKVREAVDEAEQQRNKPPARSVEHVLSAMVRSSQAGADARVPGVMRKAKYGDDSHAFDGISRPGPLADAGAHAPGKVLAAGNFRGGKYDESVLDKDTTFYRTGASGRGMGEWYSREAPVAAPRVHRSAKDGGSTPQESSHAVSFPAGTRIYSGPGHDGAEQVHVPKPWKIAGAKVVSRAALPRSPGREERNAAQPQIPQGGGSALNAELRGRMEGQLGADLSGVRVHTGSASANAASGFNARAFTVGQDVHFGAGEFAPGTKEGDRLLAHELTHTVQAQKSGIQRKEKPGDDGHDHQVSQPGEPAELEADSVADKVADRLHGKPGKAAKPGKAPAARPVAPISAKISGVGRKVFRAPTTDIKPVENRYHVGAGPNPTAPAAVAAAGQSMAENPNFEADAMAFEVKLGALAFGAGAGAGSALTAKCRAYIEAQVPVGDFKSLGAATQELLKKCGDARESFAGNVGTEAAVIQQLLLTATEIDAQAKAAVGDAEKLKAVPQPANLREQMTFVYNFANNILTKDLLKPDKAKVDELIGKANLDKNAIDERRRFIDEQAKKRTQEQKDKTKDPQGRSAWDAVGMVPQGSTAAVGGEGSAAAKTTTAVSGQWAAREDRNKAAAQTGAPQGSSQSTRTAGDVAAAGVGLSNREMAVQGIGGMGDVLKWSEGGKVWIMNEKDKWVQAMRALSLPLAAGPSGTTNALMNAAAMLGGVAPVDVRLACMGYLLPINAHSLVEICAAAAGHGVPFTAGKKIYHELPPLTEDQLRGCGRDGPDGKKLFPDEAPAPPPAVAGAAPGGAPGGGAAPGGAVPAGAAPAGAPPGGAAPGGAPGAPVA